MNVKKLFCLIAYIFFFPWFDEAIAILFCPSYTFCETASRFLMFSTVSLIYLFAKIFILLINIILSSI